MSARFDPDLRITSIRRQGADVFVSGVTALPDGARLRCQVWRGGPEGPFAELRKAETTVRAGDFECRFPASDLEGAVSAAVALVAGGHQPLAVQEKVGLAGDALAYADAVEADGSRVVVAVLESRLPASD